MALSFLRPLRGTICRRSADFFFFFFSPEPFCFVGPRSNRSGSIISQHLFLVLRDKVSGLEREIARDVKF